MRPWLLYRAVMQPLAGLSVLTVFTINVSAEESATTPPVSPPAVEPERLTVTAEKSDPLYGKQFYLENQTYVRDAPLQHSLSQREAMDIPGILGDPIKAVTIIPGVVAGSGGEIFFHGSKDGESAANINHLPVGYLFHLGGLHSVMSPEAVEQLDVYVGNFDTTYGDAIGGIIDVTPRYPVGANTAYVHLGLLDSSLGADVRLADNWTWSLHARRSYLDLIIPADTFEDDERKTTITTFPNYMDVNTTLCYTTGLHQFSLESLFAADEFGINTQENAVKDPAATGDIDGNFGFSSTGLRWVYRGDDYRANTLLGYLYEWDDVNVFNGYYLRTHASTGTLYHLSSWQREVHDFSAGFEIQRQYLPLDAQLPVLPDRDQVDFDLTSAPTYHVDQTLEPTVYSIFLQDLYRINATWRTRLGVRGEYADLGDRPLRIMPRGALIHDLGQRDTVSTSAGMYSSRPEAIKRFDAIGESSLGDETATHYAIAWNHQSPDLGAWTIEPFYKQLSHLAVSHPTQQIDDVGEGFAYGVDINYKISGALWYVYVAYAFQHAERELSSTDDRTYSFYGDVPHSFQLAGSWRFAPHWSMSFLAKYTSGQPYTPITGTYVYVDTDGTNRLRPLYGEPYSERFPDYFILNHRVAWNNTLSGGQQVEVGIELLNMTNHKNVTGFQYNDQYQIEKERTNFGFLPSLDVTVRF